MAEIPESLRNLSVKNYKQVVRQLDSEESQRHLAEFEQKENNRLAEGWNNAQEPVETEHEHVARLADKQDDNPPLDLVMRSFSER